MLRFPSIARAWRLVPTKSWRPLVILTLGVSALCAQPVRVDPSFHPNISDGRTGGHGEFTALQPGGRFLADSGRARFLPDGTRDPSYALAPQFSIIADAHVAPDGRIFARCRDLNGNDVNVILSPDGALVGHPAALIGSKGIFQPDGKLLTGDYSQPLRRLLPSGAVDPTFDVGSGGNLASLALQPDGKILVGGFFTTFDGAPRKYLVRLTSTGVVDLTFNAAVENVITVVHVLASGKVLAFDGIAKTVRLLNADGSLDRVVGLVDSDIYSFAAMNDGRALAAGGFSGIAGLPRRNLLRFNADGSLDPTFDASTSLRTQIRAVVRYAVQPDGRILVGESYPPYRLLRLNADGSFDGTFAAGAALPANYFTVAPRADGRVYVAGTFSTINGEPRAGLVRLLPDGTVDASFGASAKLTLAETWENTDFARPTRLQLLALPDGGVAVAGTFIAAGGAPRAGLARFSASGVLDTAIDPSLSPAGVIRSAALLPDGRIVVGGSFSTLNGQARANLAAFQPSGLLDAAFGVAADTNGPVRQLAVNAGGRVFLAGDFTLVAGERRVALAALTSTGTLDAAFAPSGLTSTDQLTALAPLPDGGVMLTPPLRRLKSTGETDTGFAFPFTVTPEFTALTVDGQGRVLAAYNVTVVLNSGRDPTDYVKQPFVHRFTMTGAFDSTFSADLDFPAPLSTTSVAPSTLAVSPDGSVLVGITFNTPATGPRASLVRLVPVNTTNNGLLNISTRAETGQGANVLTAGFVIGGSTAKTVLIRAAGPSLTAFGVTGALTDPTLTLFRPGAANVTNDNWADKKALPLQPTDKGFTAWSLSNTVGAFPLASMDAALVVTLAPGAYTAQAQAGGGETSGVTLIEVYDTDGASDSSRLLNLSSRGTVGTGARTLIAGFVVGGTTPRTVLVRGVGPGLTGFGTEGTLADPLLTLVNPNGTTAATNNDWNGATNATEIAAAAAKVGAFALANASKDSAILVTLPPGNYTATVNGANGTTGVALVEVYEVP